jgi:hypothetical protein
MTRAKREKEIASGTRASREQKTGVNSNEILKQTQHWRRTIKLEAADLRSKTKSKSKDGNNTLESKNNFFYWESTRVQPIRGVYHPPSLILIEMKTKSCSCLTPKLEMQNKI